MTKKFPMLEIAMGQKVLLPFSTTLLLKVKTNKIHNLCLTFVGFYLAREQAAADISISGDVGNKWTNLKSLCFELKDSVGLPNTLDTKSHLIVKLYNM